MTWCPATFETVGKTLMLVLSSFKPAHMLMSSQGVCTVMTEQPVQVLLLWTSFDAASPGWQTDQKTLIVELILHASAMHLQINVNGCSWLRP